jgi:hypothetical protein
MALKFNPLTGKLDEYGPVLTGTGTVSAAADGTAALPGIAFASDLNTGIYRPGADQLAISTGGTSRIHLDSSGRLLVGTSSESAGVAASFQGSSSSASGPGIVSIKNGTTNPTSGNALGYLQFRDAASQNGAQIIAVTDGNWASGNGPTRLVFSVTATSSASPTEALRISSNRAITVSDGGNVVLGTTTGTKIGTATTQKLGFYNATPVVQPAAVADATDAATVIAQLNDLLAKLRTLGLIAT